MRYAIDDMTIIDRNGERPACDRCHKVRVKIRRGKTMCDDCRASAWAEEIQYRQEINRQSGYNFYKLPAAKIWRELA